MTAVPSYRLESVIDENGTIVLPDDMKPLRKHRVKLVVIDLDAIQQNPVTYFEELTTRYNEIHDEPDLDIEEIYRERGQSHDRGAVFV